MKFAITVGLGLLFWLAVVTLGGASALRVYRVASAKTTPLTLAAGPADLAQSALTVGDSVFVLSDTGLSRVGEVAVVDGGSGRVTVVLRPSAALPLNRSTRATCWQTPLDAEQALTALFPDDVQARVTQRWRQAWDAQHRELADAWKPIASELMRNYLELIGEDIELALSAHEDELLVVGKTHADAFAAEWPAIQARLSPILQEHLTPVLGELMDDAVDEAPKASIAWSLARGRRTVAFERMLDWLSEYLANVPEADRQRIGEALWRSWDAARDDEILAAHFRKLGRQLRDDPELTAILVEVYREAISENPKTADYLRTEVLGSARVQEQTYLWIERFAPAVKDALAEALFDEAGVTRPEVVHLLRSIALDRRVAWVTLQTPDPDAAALGPDARIPLRLPDPSRLTLLRQAGVAGGGS